MAPQKGAYPNPPELGNALPALATGSGACGWSHGKVTAAYRGAGEAPGSFCFKVRVGGAAATAAPGNASRSKGSDSGLSFIGIKRSGQFASGRQLGFTRRLKIKAETAIASASPAHLHAGTPGLTRGSMQTNGGGGLPACQPEEGHPGTWAGGGGGRPGYMCRFMCSARWSEREKARSHRWHWKGRWPVCLR